MAEKPRNLKYGAGHTPHFTGGDPRTEYGKQTGYTEQPYGSPFEPSSAGRQAGIREDLSAVAAASTYARDQQRAKALKAPGPNMTKLKRGLKEYRSGAVVVSGIGAALIGAGILIANTVHGDNRDYTPPTIDLGHEAPADPNATYPNKQLAMITMHPDGNPAHVLFYDGKVENTNTHQIINDPIVVKGDNGVLQPADYNHIGNVMVTIGMPQDGSYVWHDSKGNLDTHPTVAVTTDAIPELVATELPNDPKHTSQEVYLFDSEYQPASGLKLHPAQEQGVVRGMLNQYLPPER